MRPVDIVLILLSILIIVLAGFAPLFPSDGSQDRIHRECEMFYGPNGPDAVIHCMAEMTRHSAAVTVR